LRPFVIKTVPAEHEIQRYGSRQLFRSSSMAEHSAVNRRVVGSSPTCGAKLDEGRWKYLQRPFVFATRYSQRQWSQSANDLMRTIRRDFSKFGNYSELAARGTAVGWITFDSGPITQGRNIGITVGGISTVDPSISRTRNMSVTVSSASTMSFTFTTNPGHVFYPGTISFSARDTDSGVGFQIKLTGQPGDSESRFGFATVGGDFEDRAWKSFLEKVRKSCGNQ
jgi:hypothetical protein